MNDFIKALTTPAEPLHIIEATFTNGTAATYTANILNLLKSDPEVVSIIDATTGELLHEKIKF